MGAGPGGQALLFKTPASLGPLRIVFKKAGGRGSISVWHQKFPENLKIQGFQLNLPR